MKTISFLQGTLKKLFPDWYTIVHYEEVIVFTCGLMKDPTRLIDYIYNMFNEFNFEYIKYWNKQLHELTDKKLNLLEKTTINFDFFQSLYSESKIALLGSPLQNKYCNWFQNDNKEILSGNELFLPSQHFSFCKLKKTVFFSKKKWTERNGKPCSMLIQNPNADVADDLIEVCCKISQRQPVTHLWLEKIRCKNTETDQFIELSSKIDTLTIVDCVLPSKLVLCLLQQLSAAKTIRALHISNVHIGGHGRYIVNAIKRTWIKNSRLTALELTNCSIPQDILCDLFRILTSCRFLYQLKLTDAIDDAEHLLAKAMKKSPQLLILHLTNCGIPEDQCKQIIQSLSKCKQLTGLDLSGNKVGTAGKDLAITIRQWGMNPPLQYLYLDNCSISQEHCSAILQSLHSCTRLTELSMTGNSIGAAGNILAECINQWGCNPPLQYLYLRKCSITEEVSGKIMKSLGSCSNLKTIDLSENTVGESACQLAQSIRQWGDNPPLQELGLGNCSIPEQYWSEIFNSLGTCNNLTHIVLPENTVGGSASQLTQSIRQWRDNPPLQQLGLGNCSIPEQYWSEIFNSLGTCNTLTYFDLSNNTLGESASDLAHAIKQWGDNPPLQQLGLGNCSIPERYWSDIFNSLGTCNNLTVLDLSENTVGESASQLALSVKQWGNNPPLQILQLYGCTIPKNASCELISTLFSCTRLTELQLAGSQLCENGLHLKRYLETITDTLEALCLDRCFIPVDVVGQILSLLSQCKKLRHLTVPGKVTGMFSNFLPNPPLKGLGLIDTELNEEDLNHLTGLVESQKLPILEKLMLYGNSLDQMEDKLEELLEACIKNCDKELIIFLCNNNLSEELMKNWNMSCKNTKITLDFQTDLDAYNASI